MRDRRSRARGELIAAGVLLLAQVAAAGTTRDHLLCYRLALPPAAVAPEAPDPPGLPAGCRIARPGELCVPAATAAERTGRPASSFVRYQVRCHGADPYPARVRDDLLDETVNVRGAAALLVPASVDGEVPAEGSGPLLCHRLGRPEGVRARRTFEDRFGRLDPVLLRHPKELCLPAAAEARPFLCYTGKLPRFTARDVEVRDGRVSATATISRPARACTPADEAAGVSPFGRWTERDGVPAFVYGADHETLPEAEWDPLLRPVTRRHWLMIGNRAIKLEAANDGTVALFDESHGLRWLTAPDPAGTGVSVIEEIGGTAWGTDYAMRGGGAPPARTFGPTWFEVQDARDGLTLVRTILCPEGEVPWVLVRVHIALGAAAGDARTVRHVERWALRPRFLSFLTTPEQRRDRALAAVRYAVEETAAGLRAREVFQPDAPGVFGPPATLVLERLGGTPGAPHHDAAAHPTLEIHTDVALAPGEERDLWFRFGREDGSAVGDPVAIVDGSRSTLAARLPRAVARRAPEAEREIPWHGAMLTGGAAVDAVVGGHTLNQGSTYAFEMGFNGAARDPLQHALPLVYTEPALALSVLRNTSAWATPEGDLPYSLDAAKEPFSAGFRPSDQNLWALWLAAEYAAATGDLAAFDAPLAYHPSRRAPAVALREHLRRQLRFFVDQVGRGERGHVRILNADWNDLAIGESGADRRDMIERGGSVLNSAMASWVLGVFAGLATRLGEPDLAAEARSLADELRRLVAEAWNGRWFHRAYAPGGIAVGDRDCWLEVQPWAILAGAADRRQARSLLRTIDQGHRAGSALGARVRWPADDGLVGQGLWGDGTRGGTWYAINMTLVWAAARVGSDIAWDEWRRMTLASHAFAYPGIWEGTLSGPDSWNGPESRRPGRTWSLAPIFAMQAFPVNNLHSHAQPLLAYLRLLGVEPTSRGTLTTGSGGRFASPTFRLEASGRGSLVARGPVTVETGRRTVRGGPGTVSW